MLDVAQGEDAVEPEIPCFAARCRDRHRQRLVIRVHIQTVCVDVRPSRISALTVSSCVRIKAVAPTAAFPLCVPRPPNDGLMVSFLVSGEAWQFDIAGQVNCLVDT